MDNYIDNLISLNGDSNRAKILDCVKNVVLALNELNMKVGGSLIETDQREDLVPFITDAAVEAGLSKPSSGRNETHKWYEDITVEWREW